MKDVVKFLKENITDNEPIVVGCSGGPDSMCLLHLIKEIFSNKLICIHINHNLREESASELEFVKKYCFDNSIIFESCTFEKKEKITESEIRKKRYAYFEEIINKYNAKYLLTAHHGDDLVETILMRLSRGSNLKGYSGIPIKSINKNYILLRPLLYLTKNNIEEYNKNNNIKYVIDKSNDTDDYTRNRYRHHVLPTLKKENNNIHLKYLKFNNELLEYHNYIDTIVLEEINKNYLDNEYSLKEFENLDDLIKRKVIEKLLSYMYPHDLELINDKHVLSILTMIKTKANGIINLPNNKIIEKSYTKLLINKSYDATKEFDYIFEDEIKVNNYKFIKTEDTNDKSNFCIKLNSNDIEIPIHIRSRKNGDKIRVKNLNGTKKVKDILIDEKIPLYERNHIPIVTDANDNILWIPGVKKSIFDKSNDENYDIIIKCISENIQNTKEIRYEQK